MGRPKEEYEVENMYIEKLCKLGYEYADIHNSNALEENFKKQFCKFNEKKIKEKKNGSAELSESEMKQVMNRVKDVHSIYEAAKILREEFIVQLDNGDSVYLKFFSGNNDDNIYQVAHQITMNKDDDENILYKNRFDVTVLINGLPLIQTELKKPGIELNEAINQINRYRRNSFKGLFQFIQIFVVSNSTVTRYAANMNETREVDGKKIDIPKALFFYWTEGEKNDRVLRLIDFAEKFMEKHHIIDMLDKYFVIKATEPILMVMRPYQVDAVKNSKFRVINENMNGYVFHTTGSGKTLTSYKLASLLKNEREIEKVIFLVDRKDLDDQTVSEYNSFEKDCVNPTESTKELVEKINSSDNKLIITTIQKLNSALNNEKYAEKMNKCKDKRYVFIIDECHRSQFGKMHAQIKKHFAKANYIGFTGTPIFDETRGKDEPTTASVFEARGEVKACIHQYNIANAIKDGNVLPFSVEYCDLFPVPTKDENTKATEKARVERISEHVLNSLSRHTRLTNNSVYTAMFTVENISLLMEYYDCMKNHNPHGYKIAAIFTYKANQDMDENPGKNAPEQLERCMKDYNEMFGTDYDLSKFDAYRNDISKRMKQKGDEQIDLLLVVNIFLTGFDSKPTNTLFIDRNLSEHTLLQAYSRTNRVDKKTKQYGQIVNYRDIKKEQDDALMMYSGKSDPNAFVIQDYDFYTSLFEVLSKELTEKFSKDTVGNLELEDDKKKFVTTFRELATTLNTLKTFSKFSWNDIDDHMDEEDYADYKSYYFEYYEKSHKNYGKVEEEECLRNIEFEVELIRTDEINVTYIANLIKNANVKKAKTDKDVLKAELEKIKNAIERSDNEKLRAKKDILISFIDEYFWDIGPDDDIDTIYAEYERREEEKEVKSFAEDHDVTFDFVNGIWNEYKTSTKRRTVSQITIDVINECKKDIKTSKEIADKMTDFLHTMHDRYTTENK